MSQPPDPLELLQRANPLTPDQVRTPRRSKAKKELLRAILALEPNTLGTTDGRLPTQDPASRNLSSVNWQGRDDAELLNGALRDREAFAVFYRQHALAIYRWFAYRVERDGALAAELTAETFAEALRALPRFKGTAAGSGTAWLFGIARNLARDHHRRRRVRDDARRELGIPRSEYADAPFDEVEDRIDSDRLRVELDHALAQLPPAQRCAVTLRIVDELDYPSIAQATATTEQAVRLRVSRGLRALRSQFAAATTEEDP